MKDFINYGRQWIDRDDLRAVEGVLKSDFLTQGPKIAELEKAICGYVGAKYCVAVSNSTVALHSAVLKARMFLQPRKAKEPLCCRCFTV
jgi:dTDP-4-amino-4,6-dideoxygalactose transaminase